MANRVALRERERVCTGVAKKAFCNNMRSNANFNAEQAYIRPDRPTNYTSRASINGQPLPVSTLNPMVGTVCGGLPCKWQRIVVFPAASRPSSNSRTAFLPPVG